MANKGFTNLAIVTKFSPLPELCDNGKSTTCGSVYRAKNVNGEVDGATHCTMQCVRYVVHLR